MANVTDPLINNVSGSDPQNLLEYLTRQRIYESRYWKETCFGLTVADVLEESSSCRCIGQFPSHSIMLLLKLLQLHPEHDLIVKSFVHQKDFKYARAIGLLYIRLTSRPVQIYQTLDGCYDDYRKLRVWNNPPNNWKLTTIDQFVHELLLSGSSSSGGSSTSSSSNNSFGIALPRLPSRRILQESGYLAESRRQTAIQSELDAFLDAENPADNINDNDHHPAAVWSSYLRHKAIVEKCPAAIIAWEKRQQQPQPSTTSAMTRSQHDVDDDDDDDHQDDDDNDKKKKKRKKDKKKQKSKKEQDNSSSYDHLFKKNKKKTKSSSEPSPPTQHDAPQETSAAEQQYSEEYWNEQRAKLGLSKLK